MLRRSRGYVPASLAAPRAARIADVLACGAELKNTFCLARDGRAWVSHHVGDLTNYATLRRFQEGIAHLAAAVRGRARRCVAHDMHPEYLSTKYAVEPAAQCSLSPCSITTPTWPRAWLSMGRPGRAVGAIFDGTGWGPDGTVWGGELLVGDLRGCERVGALRSVPMPGGAMAIRQPWRMAAAWLAAASGDEPRLPKGLAGRVSGRAWRPGARARPQRCRLAADLEHGAAV